MSQEKNICFNVNITHDIDQPLRLSNFNMFIKSFARKYNEV